MRRLPALMLLIFVLTGCSLGQGPTEKVNLHDLEPLPPSQAVATEDEDTLRMAVASMVAPEKAVGVYMELSRYLEEQVGHPVELVQRRTYAEIYDLLRSGTVDFAAVCTNVYISGAEEFGLELLAAPEIDGQATYQAFIIVRADSGIESFGDLRGKRFAFTDPLSASGRLYPMAVLLDRQTTPEAFFASTIYTYSHDNSILAVADGVVDGAAVDSLVFDQWVEGHPERAELLRVIQASEPMGSPPFVVAPHVPVELREQLQSALLELDAHPEGVDILQGLAADRLVVVPDSAYDPVRDLAAQAGGAPR